MNSIIKADLKDSQLLAGIAQKTFLESHGHSAQPQDINVYLSEKCSVAFFERDLSESKNLYHILYYDGRPAGYSKIIFDTPFPESDQKNITKLERIYLLKEFYNLKLGLQLIQFNIDLSKRNNQKGIWLFVWKENPKAINFYKKNGFVIIGSYDFTISETHSNPNHQMLLKF